MKKQTYLLFAFLCHSSFAQEIMSDWQPIFALNIGPAWNNSGTSQTFFLQTDVQKTYDATNKTQIIGVGEIFYGGQKRVSAQIIAQIGLALAAATHVNLQGDIWEDADPEFNNYNYTYKIKPGRLLLKGKWLLDTSTFALPYISGGVGAGFNHAYSFHIQPKIFQELTQPSFKSNTTTSFAYTVGAGIQKIINQQWQIGMGYELANWGTSRLSAASYQTFNSGLQLNHLYTQELLFNLSYMA